VEAQTLQTRNNANAQRLNIPLEGLWGDVMLLNHRALLAEAVHATVDESLEPNAVTMLYRGKSRP